MAIGARRGGGFLPPGRQEVEKKEGLGTRYNLQSFIQNFQTHFLQLYPNSQFLPPSKIAPATGDHMLDMNLHFILKP
jgi:hypothetical protein